MIESNEERKRMGWLEAARLLALVFAVTSCAGGSAKLASASDVSNCKPLGEVTASISAQATPDERTGALRNAATEKGATDVVSEADASSSAVRGQAYDCGYDRNGKTPSRSEQRAGF